MDDFTRSLVCGGGSSLIAKTCVAPFERCKIVLQTQTQGAMGRAAPYRGVFDYLRRIPGEQGGNLAFWRGNLTNCTRVVPTYALRFALFDFYRKIVTKGCDPNKALPVQRQLLSGALSGGTTMLVTYPLDLIRTRMSADLTLARSKDSRNMAAAFRAAVQRDGWRGLYRGLGVSMVEIMPYIALSFGGYEFLKSQLPQDKASTEAWWHDWVKLGAGWCSGVSASLFCYPLDTVKRKLMMDGTSAATTSKYNRSVLKCIAINFREGGVGAFYRGCFVNAVNSGPAAAITFVANDYLKAMMS